MTGTTNLTTHKATPQDANVVPIFSQADFPAPDGGLVITLASNTTYRFKVSSLTLDAGITFLLGDNSFIEADLKDERATLIFISAATAIVTDGTNGVRARSMIFVQAGPGELMNITSGADQTSRFIDCIFSGFGGTKPIVRGVSGQLLQLEFTAFFGGARYVQDGSGGIFGIKGLNTSAFNDGGLSIPEGMMTFETGSFTGGFTQIDTVFIMSGTDSVGIKVEEGANFSTATFDITFFVPSGAGSIGISVENPDAVNQATIHQSTIIPAAGVALKCEPVSSASFSTIGANPQGIAQDGDGNILTSDNLTNLIYRMVGISATLDISIATPGGNVSSLAWHKGNLYSIDETTQLIYEHDGFSTTINSSIASPGGDATGLTFIGENLVTIDSTNHLISIHDGFSTTILFSFASPTNASKLSITYDGVNLLVGNVTGEVFVMDAVSINSQYSFQSAAVAMADIFVIFDSANSSVGLAVMDFSPDEFHIYNHPVTFDHSSRTWELEDLPGVTVSADRGGSFFDGASIEVPTAVQNQWEDIAAAGLFYSPFEQMEKMTLGEETTGELRFNGVRDRACTINAQATITRTGNNTDRFYQLAIEINGEIIKDSISEDVLPDTQTFATLITMPISRKLIDGAVIKPKIRCVTVSPENPTVSFSKLSIT